MLLTIVVLGSVVCFFSVVAVAFPRLLLGAAEQVSISTGLRVAAALIRFAFGAVVLLAADATRFPRGFQVIGALLLLSGLVALIIGNETAGRMLAWVVALGPGGVRIAGVAGLAFGGFLLYAIS